MIIYNTTFHADKSIDKEFIEWIRREYIPKALAGGILAEPRLTRVFGHESDNGGQSYSLQFRAESLDGLSRWYESIGNSLVDSVAGKFGNAVAGFSTLLEEMEL